jgi:hypothetical protein
MKTTPSYLLPVRRGFFLATFVATFVATFATFLLIPTLSHSMNLGTIKTEIRLRIKDTNSSRQRYTDAQLTNLINQTQRDVVNFTWIVQGSSSFPLVSGTTYYSLPSTFIQILRVTYNGRKLPQATLTSLDSRFNFGSWQTTSGTPDSYFQDPTQSSKIGFFPYPNSTSTGTVNVMFSIQATDLSSDSDVPFNSETRWVPYHDLLIYEPCYKIFLIEGEVAKVAEYKNYYEVRMKQIIDLIGKNPDYLPGFSGPNPR